jgi:tousled-like kinase
MKPFGHDKSQLAIQRDQTILNAREVVFPQKPPISDGCRDFIKKCLAYHHQDRYDVYEAYYSNYLRNSPKPPAFGTPTSNTLTPNQANIASSGSLAG